MKHQHSLKPIYVCVLMALAAEPAAANPYGASVVNGQVSFATAGNTLTVTNTPGSIINWQGFSIGANEITRFAQQSASSAVLNRVISGNPSSILGSLLSNGRVYLVNPNGIVFGVGSTINVAGLVATTLNISNADFLAGRDDFTKVPGAQNISNAGNITAQSGGQIFLIAPNVENTGVITAPNGEILLAAGHSVELVNSNEPSLRVNITAAAGDATNVGQLVASAGNLGLFGAVVRNSGIVSADSATLQGGKIVLKATQRTEISGTVSANGTGGGEIKVLADMQNGTVDVNAVLEANAPSAGNGGFIETSAAHVQVSETAHISTAAPYGKSGTWLIDPQDFTIAAAGGDITGAALSTALNSSNVLIQSVSGAMDGNGDIFVSDNIIKTATAGTTTLTLQAESSIIVSASKTVASTGDALNVIFNADSAGNGSGAIVMNSGSSIASNGGNVVFGGGNALDGFGAPTGNATGNATYASGIDILGASIDTGAGNITLNGQGYDLGGTNMGVYLHSGASLTTTSGNVTINGTGGGMTDMSAGSNRGVRISSGSSIYTDIGNIDITGQGGWDGDGVQVVGGSSVTSNVGQIKLTGTSGLGTGLDFGVYLSGAGTLIETSGNILFTGVSNSVNGTDNKGIALYEVGVPLTDGPLVRAYGMGNVTFEGTGGGGTDFSSGMTISGSEVSVENGTLTLNGTSGAATGTDNRGVNLHSDAWVHANGSGNINITGVAVNDASASFGSGVRVASGAIIETTSGAINITGSGMNGTDSNYGVLITDALSAVKSASGAVSVAGSSWGTGVGNYGVYVDAGGAVDTGGTARLLADHDIYINSALTNITGGSLVLNADMNGTGVGTVTFGAGGSIAMSGGGRTDLYYNPVAYNDPLTQSDSLGNPYANITGPYTAWMLVNTLTNLQDLGINLAGNYALGTDIAAYAATPSITFSGQFDGQSHTITGLTSSLFGSIDVGAAVSNVGLVGSVVSGTSNAGALASTNYGTISNSYVSGGSVTGWTNVGGLVGSNYGSISNSYVSGGSVSGSTNVGGLVGYNSGSISNSHVDTGTVVSGSARVGGLVGYNATATTSLGVCLSGGCISNSYVSDGSVAGTVNVGGLAGKNLGDISDSYVVNETVGGATSVGGLVGFNGTTTGPVVGSIINSYVNGGTVSSTNSSSSAWVGGLVGSNYGYISSSYASSGLVSAGGYLNGVGGLVGYNSGLATVQDSYWDYNTTELDAAIGAENSLTTSNVVGLSTSDMLNKTTLTSVGFDFGSTWWMSVDNTTRPLLRSEWTTNITNAHQLQLMAMDLGASYTLGANIDAADTALASGMWGSKGFVPVGTPYYVFYGQLDGQGYTISNLTINRPTESYVGLFSELGGALRNVGLLNATVSGNYDVGGLVGHNMGDINNSYVSGGSVTGGSNVGGLVGHNMGDINNSSVDDRVGVVNVTGNSNVGGLVGANGTTSDSSNPGGTINNSYVSGGSVSGGGSNVGGLVGRNYGTSSEGTLGGIINNSWVDNGTVVSGTSSNIGGLVGYNGGLGRISNSYVDGGRVSGSAAYWGGSDIGGLVGYNSGDISNSYVNGGSVTGSSSVGGLVGSNSGTISNSYVSNGWVTVTGSDQGLSAGGLVGYNSGSISNSYASGGTVSAASNSGWNVGGLVGYNSSSGTISNSYVDGGTVTGSSLSTIGGLVGYNSGNISNSYVTNGTVNGSSNDAGGLVGSNSGSISNSYVSGGIVSGTSNVGGLVGSNSGTIINSSVTGGAQVDGNSDVGGLVGYNQGGCDTTYCTSSPGSITNSYVDNGTLVNGNYNVGGLVGYNQVATPWNSAGIISNSHYNVNDVWINDSNAVTLGGLYNDVLNVNSVGQYDDWFNGGLLTPLSIANYSTLSGSAGNYAISTADGMKDMLGFADAGYSFTLANNITLPSGYNVPYLAGNFDGGGFTIDGLDVSLPNSMIGLFNHVAVGSTLNNVVLDTSYVTGRDGVGALAGLNEGTISNSHVVNAAVSGSSGSQIGGLVGSNSGTISNSYVSGGSVSGNYLVGGLVGYNTGSISNNSYVDGVGVSGWSRVGGLVGGDYGGSISSSYASSVTVDGHFDVGGLVGVSGAGSSIDSSYVSGGVVNNSADYFNYSGNGNNAGGLVGYNSGNISNSYVDNSISGSVTAMWNVGGLVGYNDGGEGGGNITNSYVKGGVVTATAAESNVNAGGLVGYNGGSISNSYVRDNTVTNGTSSSQARIGGLVGDNAGSIGNSYVSNGTVDGNGAFGGTGTSVGGLVGYNRGIISNSYVNGGSVTGDNKVGGLVGYATGYTGSISNSYVSTNSVTGSWEIGGLVGHDSGEGAISNNFWNAALAAGNLTNGIGYAYSYPLWGPSDAGATPLNSAQMMTMANFTNAGWAIANNGGTGKVWRIYEGNTTPLLSSFLKPLSITAGSDSKPYDGLPYSGGNGVTYSDGNAPLSGTLAYAGTAQGAVDAGNYTISPTGLYSDQQGYDINFVNGALTVLGTPSDAPPDIYQLIHLPSIDFTSGLPSVTMSSVNLMFALNPPAAGGSGDNEDEQVNPNNVCQ